VALAAAAAVVVNVQRIRFERRVAREASAVLASRTGEAPAPAVPGALPAPVRRYLEAVGALRHRPVKAVRLRHGGTLRTSLEKDAWVPIQGQQYFSADPPGFVWWGRARMAPGVWMDARDRVVGGEGNMWVTVASTLTVVDARGKELDEGALHRLLGEMTWFPTAFLDPRHVRWTPVDDAHADATLRVGGREVTARWEFGPDGLPLRFSAERFRDVNGKGVLTPFVGESSDWREVDGLRVPFRVEATWIVAGERKPYARFEVEELSFDPAGPY
jgi:hypothetical protein